MSRRSLIVGIGNLLMGDDGIGVKVVSELSRRKLRNVDVIDGGTLSFQLLNFFNEYDQIIIVDAVNFGKKPGRVYKFDLDFILKRKTNNVVSIHDLDVFHGIKMLRNLYNLPRIIVIGIEVRNISYASELSPELNAAIKKAIKKIKRLVTPLRSKRAPIRRRSIL